MFSRKAARKKPTAAAPDLYPMITNFRSKAIKNKKQVCY